MSYRELYPDSTVKRKECPILNPTPSCALKNGTCFTGDVTCEPGLMCCLDNTCDHKCTHPALDDGKNMATSNIFYYLLFVDAFVW